MPYLDPVCDLRFARRLKELGVPQESYYYWVKKKYGRWDVVESHRKGQNYISAFTPVEFFDILPDIPVGGITYVVEFLESYGEYYVFCFKGSDVLDGKIFKSTNPADAYAQLYIHLLEKGYLMPRI